MPPAKLYATVSSFAFEKGFNIPKKYENTMMRKNAEMNKMPTFVSDFMSPSIKMRKDVRQDKINDDNSDRRCHHTIGGGKPHSLGARFTFKSIVTTKNGNCSSKTCSLDRGKH